MIRRLTSITLTAMLLAGCGVTTEPLPKEIVPPNGPFKALTSPQPVTTGTGPVQETLYLIRDNTLIAVNRQLSQPPTADELLKDLLAGPTQTERGEGISSALDGSEVIDGWHVDGSTAVVDLAATLVDTGRTDEVLALAQIVCTLTGHSVVTGVTFERDDKPLDVPRGDGSISSGPLTAADYQQLITPQPARS